MGEAKINEGNEGECSHHRAMGAGVDLFLKLVSDRSGELMVNNDMQRQLGK